MTSALLIFGSTFMAVFFLGLQSLNVNQGHHAAATLTSIFISTGSIGLFKYMPQGGLADFGAYYLGAILGINAGMWFHPRAKRWLEERRLRRAIFKRRGARPRALDEHADVSRCGTPGDRLTDNH